ncbi:MAG: MFS transporter [Prevotellaceae bacterium]|nr:MFS transporter [Prevotellaceae bacterium]
MLPRINPWAWVPSLYFAEGIPYVIVMTVATVMYQRLGLSNAEITLYTSWLYLPWVIKPFWSPVVDMFRTKRWWIIAMQLAIGASLAGVAFTLRAPDNIRWTLAFFWLMAFSSATHDIAADGFYMLGLNAHEQSLYVGIRSTFYRVSTIAGQGLLLMLVYSFELYTRNTVKAWNCVFAGTAVFFLLVCLYHVIMLPHPEHGIHEKHKTGIFAYRFTETFTTFFQKEQITTALLFLFLFRLPEALLTKICPLFLLDNVDNGGLALTTAEVGFVQGTIGTIGLTIGGILGGIAIASYGFRRMLWPMVATISLPDALYVLLAYYQPENILSINICIGVEQFGYGFGFTAYMMYMLYFARGRQQTAHYAFCTGIMALSMMLPGLIAGKLQEHIGYLNFFILVLCLVPVTVLVSALIKVKHDYGLKK